ncbi:MAG TPA: sulfite exporter TauE/SafE family protein [Syntrophomonadaceae bacterium]|nr:sulfite exporter TauE/SafE family protein [Syntrophomonadaceae bacterium]
MPNLIWFIAIGTTAGLLSGFFGIGGGIIVVPALIYICGFNQLLAQGTSLAIMLPPVGLLAFMEYYKNGNIDLKAGLIICITLFLGAMFGARFAHLLPADVLRKAFAVLLLLVSIKMLIGK